MTPDLLRRAIGCTEDTAARFAQPLTAACAFYGIDTPQRLAAFLAQIGHESGSLKYLAELWGPTPAQERYEGRADLGNTERGDGHRFKGRGLIQTTGRFNYRRLTERLCAQFPHMDVPDFEAHPDALCDTQWACLSAADYWDWKGLNALADAGDFEAITRRINGGLNGLADRLSRWERAKAALQVPAENNLPAEGPLFPAAPEKKPEPQPQETWHSDPIPADPVNAPEGQPMTPLIAALASAAVQVFSPLAREKIEKEMARHSDKPEVAAQIADGVINAVKAATGQPDPVQAVAQLKTDPTVVPKAEEGALDSLAKLAPVLEQLAALDKQAWDASEASMDAAARRAADGPNDQDVFLTRAIVGMVLGLMLALGALLAVMQKMGASEGTIGTLLGLFSMAAGVVVGEFKTRYQHRYGSSRSSAAKDVLVGELSKRK